LKEIAQEIEITDKRSPPAKVKAVEDDIKGQTPVKTAQRKPTKRAPPPGKSPVKKERSQSIKITKYFAVR
jgi:hypothetical protein